MTGLPLLAAAYGLVWVVVFGYLGWLLRREQRLRRDLEALRAMVERENGRWGESTQA